MGSLLISCHKAETEISEAWMKRPGVTEYIHKGLANKEVLTADSLRLNEDFEEAIHAYKSLDSSRLSIEEVLYVTNQLIYCQLLRKDTIGMSSKLKVLGEKIKKKDKPVYADFLLNTGLYTEQKGKVKKSLQALYEAAALYRKEYGKDHFKYFNALIQLGKVYRYATLEYDSVYSVFSKTVEIARRNTIPIRLTWSAYFFLADINRINRDYVSGLTNVNEFIDRYSEKPEPIDQSMSEALTTKARLLGNAGKTKEALELFESTLERLIRSDDKNLLIEQQPHIYHDILISATRQTNIDPVVYTKYIQLLEGYAVDNPLPSQVNVNRLRGRYYFGLKDFRKCIEFTEKALSEYVEGLSKRRLWIEAYAILAHSHTQVGNYDQAIEYSYRSLTFDTGLHYAPFKWEDVFSPELTSIKFKFISYRRLGDAFHGRYKTSADPSDLTKALDIYHLIDSVALINTRATDEDAVLNFLSEGYGMYSNAIDALYKLYLINQSESHLKEANYFFERSKSLIMHREMIVNNELYFPEVPGELRQREKELNKEIAALKSKGITQSSTGLNVLLEEQKTYFQFIQDNYPEYFRSKYQQDIIPYQTIKHYSDSLKQSIIQYHWGENDLYTLVISQKPSLHQVNIDSSLLYLIRNHTGLMSNPGNLIDKGQYTSMVESSYHLFGKLLPFYEDIEMYEEMLIIPAGPLNGLSFESLLRSDERAMSTIDYSSLDYLINHFNIGYSHSIRTHLLGSREEQVTRASKVIGYAFSDQASSSEKGSFNELPYSYKEVSEIQEMNESSESVFRYGKASTKESFLKDIRPGCNVIHLAMHATSSTSERLENQVFFHSNSGKKQNALFGYELLSEDLPVYLVVLSSCETGSGKEYEGEGTFSLSRAFVQSGASKVISTLWPISDRSSYRLMKAFYANLFDQTEPKQALRLAKMEYLKQSDQVTSHPYFWSSFVFYDG